MTTESKNRDFFFWLGRDGEAESVDKAEFEKRQADERERQRRFQEVDLEGTRD